MPPRVSVVVPVFNSAKTLSRTLDCVVAQTFRDFELIVVDDGSSDNSAALAQSYTGRVPVLTVIRQPNGHVARARNAGIAVAQGTYIAPLDADDLWHPSYLEKLVAALDAAGPSTVIAYAPARVVDMADNAIGTVMRPRIDGFAYHRMLVESFATASGILFRREAGKAVGNYQPDLPMAADFLIQVSLCRLGKLATVPEYLSGYRRVPGSMFSSKRETAEQLRQAFRLLSSGRPIRERSFLRAAFAGYMGWYARALRRTDLGSSARYLTLALLADPGTVVRRALRRSRPPSVRHPPGASFFALDPREPGMLEPGDPRLRPEFLMAQHLDEGYAVRVEQGASP